MAFTPLVAIPIQLQDSTTSVNMSGGSLEFFLAGTSTPTNLFSNSGGTSIGTSITLNSGGYPEAAGNVITLFRDSSIALKIVGKDASAITVWTSDGLEDSLVLLASTSNAKGASLIGVEDAGNFFAGDDQEAVNQDIGGSYLKNTVDRTGITATYTFASGGVIAMADQEIQRALLVDYAVKHNTITSVSGVLTLDLVTGNSFSTTLFENVTSIVIDNPPATGIRGDLSILFIQDSGGGAFTVAWPTTGANPVKWPGGTAPVITTTNSAEDEITLRTFTAGNPWRGGFSQVFGF